MTDAKVQLILANWAVHLYVEGLPGR